MQNESKVGISIAILTLNSSDTLGETLESIKSAIQHSPQYCFEIIVIDGGSVDTTLELVKSYFPDSRILEDKSHNLAIARNTAFEKSSSDYLTFIDSDISIPIDFFEKLMPLFDDSSVGAVSAFPHMKGHNIISEY